MLFWPPLADFLLLADELSHVQGWMEQAFYPVLLILLVAASLGLPIPEDIPLIAAGVLLKTKPSVASSPGVVVVALIGIMVGDLILYALGRRWGPGAVGHRYIRSIVTPRRFARLSERFRRHGTWCCFFGRFFMGVRAAMCVTAGATHFPYWRFFLADLAGAALSVPLFVFLGYWFAGVIDELQVVLGDAKLVGVGVTLVVATVLFILYRRRRRRRAVQAAFRHAVAAAQPAKLHGSFSRPAHPEVRAGE
ncbi:MAG: DedA family protein [Planctomycetota bacterium]